MCHKDFVQRPHLEVRSAVSSESTPVVPQSPPVCPQHRVNTHWVYQESYQEVIEAQTDCEYEGKLVNLFPPFYYRR